MATRTKDDGVTRRIMDDLLDEIDDQRARRLRERYGRVRWVLSWIEDDAGWMARISGPGRVETIERTGRTRVQAIERAAESLAAAIPKA